jgi:tetratricopeptide (TPR) repeat protein
MSRATGYGLRATANRTEATGYRLQATARALCALLILTSHSTFASGYQDPLLAIQRDLVTAYKPDKAETIAALEALTARAQALVAAHPGQAQPLVWHGVLLGKLGGAKANMSALGDVKQARKNFEAAEKLDPKALDWATLNVLADLYRYVPAWPLAFGNEKTAEKLYQRAIALNPTGAEPHRSYGNFLLDQQRYDEAERELRIALTAPLRVGEQVEPATGFGCNAARCMNHSAETDAKYRAGIERLLAKAEEGRRK